MQGSGRKDDGAHCGDSELHLQSCVIGHQGCGSFLFSAFLADIPKDTLVTHEYQKKVHEHSADR